LTRIFEQDPESEHQIDFSEINNGR